MFIGLEIDYFIRVQISFAGLDIRAYTFVRKSTYCGMDDLLYFSCLFSLSVLSFIVNILLP